MVEILQNKNSATRFQILVEIAASGPNVRQKNIAASLKITPQAVSEYIHQLVAEKLVVSTGRSSYRVSTKGVDWMLKMLRELNDYISTVTKAVTGVTTCAAIAESDITQGQAVGLKMKDGLLFATSQPSGSARGVALSSAKKGEDVAVSNIEGIVEFPRGKVTILQVPGVQKGGAGCVDLKSLKTHVKKRRQVGAIGIEALVALRRAKIEPDYLYGVAEAAVEASRCGLPFVIVCTDDAISGLIKRLQEESVDYKIIELTRKMA
jgi:putative transcriptional regulator